ncbi:MFS transporter [Actinomadura fibrosa]|nr:MFS transporter [Actinomadura fibrosa]
MDASRLVERRVVGLLAARLVGSAGDGFGTLALCWGRIGAGHGPSGLSVVLACKATPALLVLMGGLWGDRFSRLRVMAGAEALAALTWAALGALFLIGESPLASLGVLAFLAGLARVLFGPAERAVVADLVQGDRRRVGNALMNQAVSAGLLVGLACSGVVVAAVGPGLAAIIAAFTAVTGALILGAVKIPAHARRKVNFAVLTEMRLGWSSFTHHRWVWIPTLQFMMVVVSAAVFTSIIGPLYMSDERGGSGAWGLVESVEASGALVGAILAARWRPAHPVAAIVLLPATAAVPLFLTSIRVSWPVLAVAMLLPGICQGAYAVMWATMLQSAFPEHVLARVISWVLLGSFVVTPLALLSAGPLITASGVRAVSLVGGCLIVGATGLALLFTRSELKAPTASPIIDDADLAVGDSGRRTVVAEGA